MEDEERKETQEEHAMNRRVEVLKQPNYGMDNEIAFDEDAASS